MFMVEVLMSAFDGKGMVEEQNRNTRYFDDIDNAMADYADEYDALEDSSHYCTEWDVFVISIFGGSELLKMQTIRCEKEK